MGKPLYYVEKEISRIKLRTYQSMLINSQTNLNPRIRLWDPLPERFSESHFHDSRPFRFLSIPMRTFLRNLYTGAEGKKMKIASSKMCTENNPKIYFILLLQLFIYHVKFCTFLSRRCKLICSI